MGKNLIQQARGKGSPTYKSPSFRFKADVEYPRAAREGMTVEGTILDLIGCPGHTAPLMKVAYEDKQECMIIACEGVKVGDKIYSGPQSPLAPGNILPLKNIPEGTLIFNIEIKPGDGGKICRTSGTFGRLVARLPDKVVVILPSKKEKELIPECRATIGKIAGGGRLDKPFYKAGRMYHKRRARNRKYPRIGGTSQNAVDHPFGGKRSGHKGKPTIAPKHAPPGRKVGKISPRRTGMKR